MDLILTTQERVKAGDQSIRLPHSRYEGRHPVWYVGQVIKGKILARMSAGSYLLVVEGREVVARSDLSLEIGQFVVMEVQEFRDGRYMVRLLSGRPGQKEEGGEALKSLLHRLGLEDTPAHRALVQAFIAQRLPLTGESLKEASLMLGFLQSRPPGEVPTEEEIATVLHALKRELPPRPEVLQALHAFVRAEQEGRQSTITRLVDFIFTAAPVLREVLAEGQSRALLLQMEATAKALLLRPHEGSAAVAQQLRSLLSAQLPSWAPSYGYGEGVGKGTKGGGHGGTDPTVRDLPARLRLLLHLLDRYEGAGERKALAASIKEEAYVLARYLWGQHFWQVGKGEGEAHLYFGLPVYLDGQILHWGELLIRKDRGAAVTASRDFTVTVLVHTRRLGRLALEIRVRGSEIAVRGKVEHAWVGRLLDSSWCMLEEALRGLGYRLHHPTWEVARVSSVFAPQSPPEAGPAPGIVSVDAKV
ncbi:MAG TPA: hypothetical protein DEA73_06465 [Peptococcaceae bacterium]|nr:hypothetical protein [Peptococcaceae bacterium]